MMKRSITFAGAVGSSKTPIANYLSTTLNLPVFNNDAIRTEVTEDVGSFDVDTYEDLQETRLKNLLKSGVDFIYDASVDRTWNTYSQWLKEYDYQCLIVSIDLSHEFLIKLYESKNYTEFESLKVYVKQHKRFLEQHGDSIGLHISEEQFASRMQIAYLHCSEWLST